MEANQARGAKPWLKLYDEGLPAFKVCSPVPLDRRHADSAAKHPRHTAIVFTATVASRSMSKVVRPRLLGDTVTFFAAPASLRMALASIVLFPIVRVAI